MKTIRIQKNVSPFTTVKKWEVFSKCREDCVGQTLWFLREQNPDQEFRIAPLDAVDKAE